MTSRERIRSIIAREPVDRCGFWLGDPLPPAWERLSAYLGIDDKEAIRRHLKDDFRWTAPWRGYKHPEGHKAFRFQEGRAWDTNIPGVFADCEDPQEVHDYPWPDVKYLDFSDIIVEMRRWQDFYVATGVWATYFSIVADAFGMENYFIKMHTDPEVVDAVTQHVGEYLVAANERLFAEAGDLFDGWFFGNDFGTQRGLFISPAMYDRFVHPWFSEFCAMAKRHGKQVIHHSCGSTYAIMDRFLDARLELIHPLQVTAKDMEAERMAEFKDQIAFMGGVDTQHLLIHATPGEVKAEVRRLKSILGPHFIVSPAHEGVQGDIPPENLVAMAEAAVEE